MRTSQVAAPEHGADEMIENSLAFRGYLIRRNPITESYWIQADGAFIGWAKDAQDAKRIIEEDLGANPF